MASAFKSLEDFIRQIVTEVLDQHSEDGKLDAIIKAQVEAAQGQVVLEQQLDSVREQVAAIFGFIFPEGAPEVVTPEQIQGVDTASAQLAQTNTALEHAIKQQENT